MSVSETMVKEKVNSASLNFRVDGLDCAACAAKIEREIEGLRSVTNVVVSSITEQLTVHYELEQAEHDQRAQYIEEIQKIVDRIEPDVKAELIHTGAPAAHDNQIRTEDSGTREIEPETEFKVFGLGKETLFMLGRVVLSLALILLFEFLPLPSVIGIVLAVAAYLLGGFDVFWAGIRSIARLNIANEKVLMTVATIGAFILGEYTEAVAVMLFYQVGEMIQDLAVDRSRDSITALIGSLKSDHANLLDPDTKAITRVAPEAVETGSLIVVRAGEKVPLDGLVVNGSSYMNTAALTGESVPRSVVEGDTVSSGFINTDGLLTIRTNSLYEDSTVERILTLVKEAAEHKAPTERYISRFARIYTPVVMALALLLATVPPLILPDAGWQEWTYRALIFLVVSCPCALVVSVPLGFFGGIGSAGKHGILVKGADYLEALANVDTAVFDKTGTLTKGSFVVTKVQPSAADLSEADLLQLAALAEMQSNHPIAEAIYEAAGRPVAEKDQIENYREVAGRGTVLTLEGVPLLAGNLAWLQENSVDVLSQGNEQYPGTTVYLASGGEYIGRIQVEDEIKDGVSEAIADLKKQGLRQTIMLSGDTEASARNVSEILKLDRYVANCLPQDKLDAVSRYQDETRAQGKEKRLIFVGDGINDAPALARADVGIAMGVLGQAAAIEAADVVLVDDNLSKLTDAHRIAKFTKKVVAQNIALAISVKLLVLLLSALGYTGMWGAVFADVGVTLIAVLNSVRVLTRKV